MNRRERYDPPMATPKKTPKAKTVTPKAKTRPKPTGRPATGPYSPSDPYGVSQGGGSADTQARRANTTRRQQQRNPYGKG